MFKKLRNKLLIINTLIIAALVLSSFSVIYIMTAQNVNKSISQKLDRAIEFIRPDHNPRQKDNMQKPIDDVPPNQNGNVPPNPNTVDPNADNINKSDKQKQEFSLTFTVTTDTDGNVEKVNAPFDLTEDFYTDKINNIIYGSEDKGQIRSSNGYWSYKVVPLDTGFIIAFTALLFFVSIPKSRSERIENVFRLAKEGLGFLKRNPMILTLLWFLSGINLVSSAFDAVLPGFVLPNPKGSQTVLGIVTSCSGAAMIVGSLIVSALPKPKDRVKIVYLTMLFAMGTENFILAFSREPVLWCIGQAIGWLFVPVMSTNLEVILRGLIPVELQGRVYACRNTLQFFTIPIGLFLGGFMVDDVCEPFMVRHGDLPILRTLFGIGKGSGAALMLFILGVTGSLICIIVGGRLKKYHYSEM